MGENNFQFARLLLDLHKFYQPIAEKRGIRLNIMMQGAYPEYLNGDFESVFNELRRHVEKLMELQNKRYMEFRVKWHGDCLSLDTRAFDTAALASGFALTSGTVEGQEWIESSMVKIEVSQTKYMTENEKMVVDWMMKDIEVSDLIEDLIHELPSRMEIMDQMLSREDIKPLMEALHALKGITGTFKMSEIYTLIVEMHGILKEKQETTMRFRACFDQFCSLVSRTQVI